LLFSDVLSESGRSLQKELKPQQKRDLITNKALGFVDFRAVKIGACKIRKLCISESKSN